MDRLKDRSRTPPHGFSWKDPITGGEINARNHSNWISQASLLREANGLEIPTSEEMEDQLCGKMKPLVRAEHCGGIEPPVLTTFGPGSILKRNLHSFGIRACWGCLDLAAKMDDWGPDGCEENMTYIVEAMKQNAEHRKWYRWVPFASLGCEAIVRLAISQSRAHLETS